MVSIPASRVVVNENRGFESDRCYVIISLFEKVSLKTQKQKKVLLVCFKEKKELFVQKHFADCLKHQSGRRQRTSQSKILPSRLRRNSCLPFCLRFKSRLVKIKWRNPRPASRRRWRRNILSRPEKTMISSFSQIYPFYIPFLTNKNKRPPRVTLMMTSSYTVKWFLKMFPFQSILAFH